jgi:hypothetical protein
MYGIAFSGFRLQEAEQGGHAEAEAARERQPPPAVQEGEAGHPKEQEDTPLHQVVIPIHVQLYLKGLWHELSSVYFWHVLKGYPGKERFTLRLF